MQTNAHGNTASSITNREESRLRVILASRDATLIRDIQAQADQQTNTELLVCESADSLMANINYRWTDLFIYDADSALVPSDALSWAVNHLQPESRLVLIGEFEEPETIKKLMAHQVNGLLDKEYLYSQVIPLGNLFAQLQLSVYCPKIVRCCFGLTKYPSSLVTEEVFGDEINPLSFPHCETRSTSNVLTAREKEVLVLGADGLVVQGIADSLNLSVHTVNTHLKNIYRKLEVKTRGSAIQVARELCEI